MLESESSDGATFCAMIPKMPSITGTSLQLTTSTRGTWVGMGLENSHDLSHKGMRSMRGAMRYFQTSIVANLRPSAAENISRLTDDAASFVLVMGFCRHFQA